jgi:hypothetical protein
VESRELNPAEQKKLPPEQQEIGISECPLTSTPLTELDEAAYCVIDGHVYEKSELVKLVDSKMASPINEKPLTREDITKLPPSTGSLLDSLKDASILIAELKKTVLQQNKVIAEQKKILDKQKEMLEREMIFQRAADLKQDDKKITPEKTLQALSDISIARQKIERERAANVLQKAWLNWLITPKINNYIEKIKPIEEKTKKHFQAYEEDFKPFEAEMTKLLQSVKPQLPKERKEKKKENQPSLLQMMGQGQQQWMDIDQKHQAILSEDAITKLTVDVFSSKEILPLVLRARKAFKKANDLSEPLKKAKEQEAKLKNDGAQQSQDSILNSTTLFGGIKVAQTRKQRNLHQELVTGIKNNDPIKKIGDLLKQIKTINEAYDDKTGASPLLIACIQLNEIVVKALLEKGAYADVSVKKPIKAFILHPEQKQIIIGTTPLISMMTQKKEPSTTIKKITIARFLLDHKANINAADKNGNTPLHWAACRADEDMVFFLLKQPLINPTYINHKGKTPLEAFLEHPFKCQVPSAILKIIKLELWKAEKRYNESKPNEASVKYRPS